MRRLIILLCLPMLLAAAPEASGEEADAIATCDRLAADPFEGFGPRSWDRPFQDIDAEKAVPACEAAMRQKPGDARYRLQMAVAYLAAREREKARPLLQGLAAENNAQAMVLLADISTDKESVALIEKAAALNNTAALIFLAFAQLTGDGVKQNVREGVKLLSHASDLGNTEAMIILAGVYFEGQFGVPPDAAEGRRLITRAAELGNPSARDVLSAIKRAQDAATGRTGPATPPAP